MDSATEWSGPPDDTMAQMATSLEDLGNLFEFGDIDLNTIPSVDSAHYDDHLQRHDTHPSTPFDELNEGQSLAGTNAQDFGAHQQFGMHQSDHGQHHRYNGHGQTSNSYAPDAGFQQQMQQGFHPTQHFQFQAMQGFPSTQHVPPTPNSFEMHGESGRFLQQQMDPQQRAILEQRYQLRKDAYTPMASPAGTPQFTVQPEFTIPGAYFSPLTSPMLHAQNAQNQPHAHQQGYYTNPSTAPSSNATSPLDPNLDVDMLGDEISLNDALNAHSRKSSRRKIATPRSAGPLGKVKQSPIQKAMKRKSGTMLSSLAPARESNVTTELQRSKSAQSSAGGVQIPRQSSSEDGSISPEPLSEALMAPPPRPASRKTESPAIVGTAKDGTPRSLGKAATPKSILSMRGPHGASGNSGADSEHNDDIQMDFEELELPAAADNSSRPTPLSRIDTSISSTLSEDTPVLSARKTPKLGPQSTPSARPPSAGPSPSIIGSPMTASTPGALLKNARADSKGGRGNKKRVSVSGNGSALVSPALRPRISPSIKPLLPEGAALHSPTHALLLASKSNYQNLLEGNHLPGVSYPDSLSTGLTSKRTSHKVAEQGRRNRINEALKEMQALLPKPALPKGREASNSEGSPDATNEADSKDSKEDALAKSNSSKAATVESANEYIRKLQRENATLLQLKREHEEMKKKFEESGKSLSADSPGSASDVSGISVAVESS